MKGQWKMHIIREKMTAGEREAIQAIQEMQEKKDREEQLKKEWERIKIILPPMTTKGFTFKTMSSVCSVLSMVRKCLHNIELLYIDEFIAKGKGLQ